jgi:hypothetical protein
VVNRLTGPPPTRMWQVASASTSSVAGLLDYARAFYGALTVYAISGAGLTRMQFCGFASLPALERVDGTCLDQALAQLTEDGQLLTQATHTSTDLEVFFVSGPKPFNTSASPQNDTTVRAPPWGGHGLVPWGPSDLDALDTVEVPSSEQAR